jgi:hypothetical protein
MVRRPLETDRTEGVEEEKNDSSTQVEKGRREEKTHKASTVNFGVWNK